MADSIIFAGTGDSLGIPRVYCDCAICEEARHIGTNRRLRSSIVLATDLGNAWLDCGPDWRLQMERLESNRIDLLLITHPHHDHIGGLPELADAARWGGYTPTILAPASVIDAILGRYPWISQWVLTKPITQADTILGYQVKAWEVSHGHSGRSFAYRFDRTGYAWAYCPDSLNLTPSERILLHNLDLLIIGTAYPDTTRPLSSRTLYSMVEALELLNDVSPRHAIFTHFSHEVDSRQSYGLPGTVVLAYDGLKLDLQDPKEQSIEEQVQPELIHVPRSHLA